MLEIRKKMVNYTVEQATTIIEEACNNNDFMVLMSKNLGKSLKEKLGITDYEEYMLILACNPEVAKQALDINIEIGTLFPCSFVVYRQDGQTVVAHASIMKIAIEVGLATEEEMTEILKILKEKIDKIWEML